MYEGQNKSCRLQEPHMCLHRTPPALPHLHIRHQGHLSGINRLPHQLNHHPQRVTLITFSAKYPTWGQFPGTVDASYTHTATLYNLTIDVAQYTLRVKPSLLNLLSLITATSMPTCPSGRETKGPYSI